MKPFVIVFSLALGMFAVGCGEAVPVSPVSKDGANPYVSGSPEERIKSIEADASLSAEEKTRRIGVIKERNNLK